MKWQTTFRNVGDSASPTRVALPGTPLREDYVEGLGLIYLAPEITQRRPAHATEP